MKLPNVLHSTLDVHVSVLLLALKISVCCFTGVYCKESRNGDLHSQHVDAAGCLWLVAMLYLMWQPVLVSLLGHSHTTRAAGCWPCRTFSRAGHTWGGVQLGRTLGRKLVHQDALALCCCR